MRLSEKSESRCTKDREKEQNEQSDWSIGFGLAIECNLDRLVRCLGQERKTDAVETVTVPEMRMGHIEIHVEFCQDKIIYFYLAYILTFF